MSVHLCEKLFDASFWGHENCLQTLIVNGANINYQGDGITALQLVAMRGYKDCVQTLLFNGATVNLQDNDGWTALHYASAKKNIECIRVLLNYGADIPIKTNTGFTAFDLAKDTEIEALLLEYDELPLIKEPADN